MRNLSPLRSLVSLQGETGGVFLVLVAEEQLLVEAGVAFAEFQGHPGAQDEALVLDQEVVVEVEALAAGEFLPKVDAELVRKRCCGASC